MAVMEDKQREAKETELRALYKAFAAIHGDVTIAPSLAGLIREFASEVYPVADRDFGEVVEAGLRYRVDLSERLGREFYFGSGAERLERRVVLESCPPGGTVVDVGANFGLYSMPMARQVGPQGQVLAFEPNPRARALLLANLRANELENVVASPNALGAAETVAEFYATVETAFSGLSDTKRSEVESVTQVEVLPLDRVWARRGKPRIAVMKIDVEGHESAVLEGAKECIASSPDLVLMLEASQKNYDDKRRAATQAILERWIDEAWQLLFVTNTGGLLSFTDAAEFRGAFSGLSGNAFLARSSSPVSVDLRRRIELLHRANVPSGPPVDMLDLRLMLTLLFHRHKEAMATRQQLDKLAQAAKQQLTERRKSVEEEVAALRQRVKGQVSDELEAARAGIRAEVLAFADKRALVGVKPEAPTTAHARRHVVPNWASTGLVLVATGSAEEIFPTLASLEAENAGWPSDITVVLPTSAGGSGIGALSDRGVRVVVEKGEGLGALLAAGLRASASRFVLLLQAGALVRPGSLEAAFKAWAWSGTPGVRPLVAMAFPTSDDAGTGPRLRQSTLGGFAVVRQGLVDTQYLGQASTCGLSEFRTDLSYHALSLQLTSAPGEVLVSTESCVDLPRDARLLRLPADADPERAEWEALRTKWRGRFDFPLLPKLFRQPATVELT